MLCQSQNEGLNHSAEKGAGTKNAKHALGRSGFWYVTPFSLPTRILIPDRALVLFENRIGRFLR